MNAFARCPKLERLIIPETVITIGNNILRYNNTHVYARTNIAPDTWSITWNNGNEDQNVEYGSEFTPDMEYKSVQASKALNLYSKESITEDYYVVSDFQEFTEERENIHIHIPATFNGKPVVGIEGSAFYDNHVSLLTIEYDNSPIFIGDYAFFGLDCDTIIINRDIDLEFDGVKSYSVFSTATFETVALPNTITTISPYMFDSCLNLSDICFIEPKEIVLDESDKYFDEKELSILDGFQSTQKVSLPDSIVEICDGAFVWISNILELNIPENIRDVGNAVFEGWGNGDTVQYIYIDAESEQALPIGWVNGWNSGCADGVIQYTGEYEINYHADGGTHSNPNKYTSRDLIILENAKKTGYTFEGWYKDSDFIDGITEIKKGSSGDLNLFAKFRRNIYKIAYNSNKPENASGNVIGEMDDSTVIYDTQQKLRQTGFRLTGWTFIDWIDENGNRYEDEEVILNLSNIDNDVITLYAEWRANTYTINYNTSKPSNASGVLSGIATPSVHTYDTESRLMPNPFSLVGWEFVRWIDSEGNIFENNATILNLSAGEGIVNLFAQWQANEFRVIYDKNLEVAQGEMLDSYFRYDTKSMLNRCQYSAEHYKFVGWNDNKGNRYADCADVTNIVESGEITLYAQWELENVTIKFIATFGGRVEYSEKIYQYGAFVEFPEATRENSRFRSWLNSEDIEDIAFTGDIRAYQNRAYFTSWVVDVYFNFNGGSTGTSYNNVETVGRVIQLPSATHYAYLSGKWDDMGVFGDNYQVVNPINTIAIWSNPKSFAITYECIEGDEIDGALLPQSYTIESPTIKFEYITRDGYKLSSSTQTIPTGSFGDIHIKYYWSPIEYHFTAVTGGALRTVSIDSFGTIYGVSHMVTAPDFEGYVFKHWETENGEFISSNKTVEVKTPTIIENDYVIWFAIYEEDSCVAEGTLITLADGSKKAVEDLTGDEMLLVWNLHTGSFDYAPMLFIDKDPEMLYRVINLTFSDGTIVKVISEHGFWDVDMNRYVYLDENAAEFIGHRFMKQSGSGMTEVTLTNVEIRTETTRAYSPVTYGHLCYYVNGMLSMPGGITGLFNIFETCGDLPRYDADAMAADIDAYGLFTYEEFRQTYPVSEEVFEAFNGRYLKVAIGKGLITQERIGELIERYSEFFRT